MRQVVRSLRLGGLDWGGDLTLYRSRYDDDELAVWAARLRASPTRDTWLFFDNDAEAHAADDARQLREMLDGR